MAGKSYVSRPEGMTSVRLDLDPGRHARLRVLAAQAGVPMSQYVRSLVEAHLDAPVDAAKRPRLTARKKS